MLSPLEKGKGRINTYVFGAGAGCGFKWNGQGMSQKRVCRRGQVKRPESRGATKNYLEI